MASRTTGVAPAAARARGGGWLAIIARYRKAVLVAVLLVAAAFRFVGLNNTTPPGLEHDEVAHWLINRDILAGNHAIYFTEAYGHEALFHYVQAGFGALTGDNALTLRLPAAYFGLLLVAVSYALGARLFGWRVGLASAAFMAVLFWPVFYSRLALRAISLPVLSGLSAYAWWRGWRPGKGGAAPRVATGWFLLAGALAGLSLHTYMAARAVPIFYALLTAYLLIAHRGRARAHRRGLVVFWLALAVVAAPLAVYLLTNPGAEVRIGEVDAPLRALLAGDWRPVLDNTVRIAGMFAVRGDPLWRQNIADQPVFDPILGVLFYAGVAIALWRWRDDRHAFLVLWLATAVIPSLVTVDAPSSIRIINLLPVLMLYPLLVIHTTPHLSTISAKLSTELGTRIVIVALALLWLYHAWHTAVGLWRVWPANDEVQFVWQTALTEAAATLDVDPAAGPVAVGGWTPATMDPPTMELTLRRDDLALRYFDPRESLLLPAPVAGAVASIVKPSILPFAPALQPLVAPLAAPGGPHFDQYRYTAAPDLQPSQPIPVDFGGELTFLGFDAVDGCAAGGPCTLATYWRVTGLPDGPRRVFLHAVDAAGNVIAQDDRLGAPAAYWQVGDTLVQVLTLPATAGELRLGVYDPVSGARLRLPDGQDYTVLSLPAAD